ncbi:10913_t:CDS:2 [Paraglomus brasilianum]|uniref:10913_t:CDS:1 n=1 Tax=Paraglomus brasilianum TaxID=144538 RepID=A0A9N8Z7D8_9GLOM|nr:10913_t:CDS:2 [Paraglomus brasilianum]
MGDDILDCSDIDLHIRVELEPSKPSQRYKNNKYFKNDNRDNKYKDINDDYSDGMDASCQSPNSVTTLNSLNSLNSPNSLKPTSPVPTSHSPSFNSLSPTLSPSSIENSFLKVQNCTLEAEITQARITIQALKQVIQSKDEALRKAQEEYQVAMWRINLLEAHVMKRSAAKDGSFILRSESEWSESENKFRISRKDAISNVWKDGNMGDRSVKDYYLLLREESEKLKKIRDKHMTDEVINKNVFDDSNSDEYSDLTGLSNHTKYSSDRTVVEDEKADEKYYEIEVDVQYKQSDLPETQVENRMLTATSRKSGRAKSVSSKSSKSVPTATSQQPKPTRRWSIAFAPKSTNVSPPFSTSLLATPLTSPLSPFIPAISTCPTTSTKEISELTGSSMNATVATTNGNETETAKKKKIKNIEKQFEKKLEKLKKLHFPRI